MRISDWSSDLCSSDLMEWAIQDGDGCAWIASFPTDAPFLPRDLVARMADAVERRGADMACAASGGRAHPVIGLWPIRLKDDLSRAMAEEGLRKVDAWTARYRDRKSTRLNSSH